ncbi:polycomb group RING finger protein 6 isoform X3 [Ranitomeya variabilis]|uniref:polycomb group RING finger protein 6 isoform X3 n=1 Tax=Ranitomeya variabilis TaxID=490064 RepID=UPI0040565A67
MKFYSLLVLRQNYNRSRCSKNYSSQHAWRSRTCADQCRKESSARCLLSCCCRGGMELEFVKCEEEERTRAALGRTAASITRSFTRSSFGDEDGRSRSGSEEALREHMIRLADLNPYILCSICQGYFIDATTITECLHTFCKSCIVQHFYYNNRCPKCNVIVHQTQPLYNIRLDRQLQDLVFKLVVNLEDREKNQMYDFYRERGLEVPKPVVPHSVSTGRGRQKKPFGPLFQIPPELDVSLLLEFIGADEGTGSFKPLERRFVRVSGDATIGHVEKFIRRKMELNATCQICD